MNNGILITIIRWGGWGDLGSMSPIVLNLREKSAELGMNCRSLRDNRSQIIGTYGPCSLVFGKPLPFFSDVVSVIRTSCRVCDVGVGNIAVVAIGPAIALS